MEDLKDMMDSEYQNTVDLLGNPSEVFNKLSRLPKEQQAGAIKKILQKPATTVVGHSSRMEFEHKFSQLPKEIREGLLKKRLQLVDTRFYIVKDIEGKSSIDVFQGTDNKNIALGNIANQKLEKDNWFILSAIRLLYAESADGKEKAKFDELPPIIMNGEFELEVGNKKLFGLTDNEVFDTRDRTDVQIGYYKLESTKIIEPQVEIKMPIKFTAAAEADTFLKTVFIGTSVIPY